MATQRIPQRSFFNRRVNDRTIHHDLALAGKIQRSLFPPPEKSFYGFDLAGHSIACSEVGGDYFDYLHEDTIPGNSLKVIIGDVSGHGVDAALLMSSARSFIHGCSTLQSTAPAKVVSALNHQFSADIRSTGHFMTMFYMDLNLESGKAYWVRAGHEPAIIYNPKTNHFWELKGKGLPLGVDVHFHYEEYQHPKMQVGTVIALGTDGIWEARNTNNEYFGKRRYKALIKHFSQQPARVIVDCILQELKCFCQGRPPEDDITLVIIKVTL